MSFKRFVLLCGLVFPGIGVGATETPAPKTFSVRYVPANIDASFVLHGEPLVGDLIDAIRKEGRFKYIEKVIYQGYKLPLSTPLDIKHVYDVFVKDPLIENSFKSLHRIIETIEEHVMSVGGLESGDGRALILALKQADAKAKDFFLSTMGSSSSGGAGSGI